VTPDATGSREADRLRRGLAWLLAATLPILLAQAVVPIEQFVHRGDDAFYYFQMAAQYPRLGFWSFDGIHPTNGVQPLWALLLTGVALLLHQAGVTDPGVLARIFVACAAACHCAASLLLFHLLARTVSVQAGLVAAGAFLVPMGIVWSRLWGMENSLYALLLTASLCHLHLVVLRRPTVRAGAAAGALLGLTALARLNAALLAPVAVLYLAWKVTGLQGRRVAAACALGGVLVVAPYFIWNLATTGHLLPVSGVVKDLRADGFLAAQGLESRWSLAFPWAILDPHTRAIRWFVTSRVLDTSWIAGGRLLLDGDSGLTWRYFIPLVIAVLLLPLAAASPGRWVRVLAAHLGRLKVFAYVLIFALINLLVSVIRYPSEVGYGMIRWWLVESEIVIVTLASVVVAGAGAVLGRRFLPSSLRPRLLTGLVVVLLALHAGQTVRFYWSDRVVQHDWKLSWNDEIYAAALWLNDHVPPDARVGSWNAGLLGYYTVSPVINLDGLANSFELVPYLESGRLADYIRLENIRYLSDIESEFDDRDLDRDLRLTEIYSRYSPFIERHYRIFRVERATEPGPDQGIGHVR
jgi:hypothetical protein